VRASCRFLLVAAAISAVGCARAAPPRVLLLVSVDTLRADHLGAFGSELGLTPHLDALARESLVFEAAYAAAPLTLPSLATLFTGRYPEELGIESNESTLPGGIPTLATELRERGWRTAAVASNFVLRDVWFAHGEDLAESDPERVRALRERLRAIREGVPSCALRSASGALGRGARAAARPRLRRGAEARMIPLDRKRVRLGDFDV
jgi:predicted AlkP superfamily pyrophosphatase or phosphodiesterase